MEAGIAHETVRKTNLGKVHKKKILRRSEEAEDF
jgi:hypothetical protein